MKKISFTLQDSPNHWMGLDAEIKFKENGECSVSEETAIAILINKRFPQLQKCNRRIKKLIVIDENNEKYSTDDFDLYSLTKTRQKA